MALGFLGRVAAAPLGGQLIDLAHLAPAIGGLALHWLALPLLFPYMKPAAANDIRRWDELLSSQ